MWNRIPPEQRQEVSSQARIARFGSKLEAPDWSAGVLSKCWTGIVCQEYGEYDDYNIAMYYIII